MSNSTITPETTGTEDETCIPISSLDPGLPNLDTTFVKATVAVLWPYSPSNGTLKLLIVEPDFRLRSAKGQVQVRFSGSSARAIASAGIGNGDTVTLSLAGVTWCENVASSFQVPGHNIEWQLEYSKGVKLQIRSIDTETVKTISVDNNEAIQNDSPRISTPDPPPSPAETLWPSYRSSGKHPLTDPEWSSPAFLKRARVSYGSLLSADIDSLAAEAETVSGRVRKNARFNRQNMSWRYNSLSRSPTPEPLQTLHSTGRSSRMLEPRRMTDEACQTIDYVDPETRTSGIPCDMPANESQPLSSPPSPNYSQPKETLFMGTRDLVHSSTAVPPADTLHTDFVSSTDLHEQSEKADDMSESSSSATKEVGMSKTVMHEPSFDCNTSVLVSSSAIDDQYGHWQSSVAEHDSLTALGSSSIQDTNQHSYARSLTASCGDVNSGSFTPLIHQSYRTINAVLNKVESETIEHTGNIAHVADARRYLRAGEAIPSNQDSNDSAGLIQLHVNHGRYQSSPQHGVMSEEPDVAQANSARPEEISNDDILERKHLEHSQTRDNHVVYVDDEFMRDDLKPRDDETHEEDDNSFHHDDHRKEIGEDSRVDLGEPSNQSDEEEEDIEEDVVVAEIYSQENAADMSEEDEAQQEQAEEQGNRHSGWTVSGHDYSAPRHSRVVEDAGDEDDESDIEDHESSMLFDDSSLHYLHETDEEDEEYISQDSEALSASEHNRSEASTDHRGDVDQNIGRQYNEPEIIDLLSDSESEPERVTPHISICKDAFAGQTSGQIGDAESSNTLLPEAKIEMDPLSPPSEDEMDKGKEPSPSNDGSHQNIALYDGSIDEDERRMIPSDRNSMNDDRAGPVLGLLQEIDEKAASTVSDDVPLPALSIDRTGVRRGTESYMDSKLLLMHSHTQEGSERSEIPTTSVVDQEDHDSSQWDIRQWPADDIDPNLENENSLPGADATDSNTMHSAIEEVDHGLATEDGMQGAGGRGLSGMHPTIRVIESTMETASHMQRADVKEIGKKDVIEYLPTPESTGARMEKQAVLCSEALVFATPKTNDGCPGSIAEISFLKTPDESAVDMDDTTTSVPVLSGHTALLLPNVAWETMPAVAIGAGARHQTEDVADLLTKDESAEAIAKKNNAKHDIKEAETPTSQVRSRLRRSLQTNLGDFIVLKVLRFSLEKKVDVLAIATSGSSEPQKVKNGPKHWATQLTIADASTPQVVEVQIFRPHLEALPVVHAKDAVLLRHFSVKAGKGRQFALRSNDASSWVIFENSGEARMTGPPVEYGDGETKYLAELQEWCQDPSSAMHERFVQ